jgi:ESCRT-II complex subunit VPS22
MRRRAGVSAIKHANELEDKFRRLGVARARFDEEETRKQLRKFISQLERFAASHRDGIRADPELRAAFHAMCASVGVDPLASRKSAWAQILGLGDFYVELAVGVADCCLASRAHDGGLCELRALVERVNRRRSSAVGDVSADDVERAIGALASLGGGWRVESTPSNASSLGAVKMVRSVPMELSDDINIALAFAKASSEGRATTAALASSRAWSPSRARAALEAAVKLGIALVDDQNPDPGRARAYWFPAFRADLYAG